MRIYKHILALPALILALLAVSCEDRFDWQSQDIGEGEAQVDAILEFPTTSKSLGGARSAGNSIQDITKLSVVVFKNDGTILDVFDNVAFTRLESTPDTPSDYPKDENGNIISSDFPTTKVQAGLKLPYGRYTMYAVANLDRALTKAEFEDKEDPIAYLKGIECEWNPTDITKNAQMFGYFTNDIAGQNTSYEGSAKPGNGTTTNPETPKDPTVLVNKTNVSLYSWIKRLASKVTIAYDGSGLKNGIYVYVHNVSIRQIPLKCTLGDGNSPSSASEVTSARFNQSVTEPEQALYYNGNGQLTNASPYDYSGDKYHNWMTIAKGNGIQGAADHSVNDPALFFYENMQGVHPDRPKEQQADKVGINVGPADDLPDGYTDEDYRDDVDYGTFIEVEGYYQCNVMPISYGPIRYRFMLGQNTSDNYDAIRNCHYKLTLGFRGYANQPDWHIEYIEQENEIYAQEVNIPYTYNTSVPYDLHFTGNLVNLEAQIIENNWAPFYETGEGEVPTTPLGSTSFDDRTLIFEWNRAVYLNTNGGSNPNGSATAVNTNLSSTLSSTNNTAANYLYGRHYTDFFKLDEDGNNTTERYYVTPIWAGFLRLQVPHCYENSSADEIPAVCVYNRIRENEGDHYNSQAVLTNFRNYYLGGNVTDAEETAYQSDPVKYNLGYRRFDLESLGTGTHKYGVGNNECTITKGIKKDGQEYTDVTMNLWTQPKSMCGNSGFSGNNPYEDFNRKAVIRFTATFKNANGTLTTKRKDVRVLQAKRLVNPKAVWRRHDNPQDFEFSLMERNIDNLNDLRNFRVVESRGTWSASIKQITAAHSDFIKLVAWGGSQQNGDGVKGDTGSEIKFKIDFKEAFTNPDDAACAIIEIRYHDEKCVHNVFVRQGYNKPVKIDENSNFYWSSFNLFNTTSGTNGVMTNSPLAFGTFMKRGNYAQPISVSNISRAGMGPRESPGNAAFTLETNPTSSASWANITGQTAASYQWPSFTCATAGKTRTYTVPTIAQFQTLMNHDFGIGVMYGDGATEPGATTARAYGYLDSSNKEYIPTNSADVNNDMFKYGMRGFIAYNVETANQIFLPIGTSGLGRRTIQLVTAENQRGMLRYGSLTTNLTGVTNAMRPIPYNLSNNPGAIYWAFQTTSGLAGWDMNYFDLNFNAIGSGVVFPTSSTTYPSGPNGDALPVRLVTENP